MNKSGETQKNRVEINEENSSTLDRSKYSLELVNGWIIAADTKVSISCGVFSVMAAVLVFIAENTLDKIDKSVEVNACFYNWFAIAGIISAITFLISVLLHLKAIYPSFESEEHRKWICRNHVKDKTKQNAFSLFYNKIRLFESSEEYIQSVRDCSEIQFEEELLREVYFNSKICTKKMVTFRYGILFGGLSIFLIVICSIFYYCAYTIH